jgi:hypothetical protein
VQLQVEELLEQLMSTAAHNSVFFTWPLSGSTFNYSGLSSDASDTNSMTIALNSVSSMAEHAVSRAAGCEFEPRTECQSSRAVSLTHCMNCKKLFASSKEWLVRPGDFIEQFRAEGSAPIVLCERCETSATFEDSRASKETVEIMRALRDERDAALPPRMLLHEPRKGKRDAQSERKARQRWAAWRVPLALAFIEHKELQAKQIAAIMGYKTPTARQSQSALWRARQSGFEIVVLGRVARNRRCSQPVCVYGLRNGESMLPPQDKVTKKFMKKEAASA